MTIIRILATMVARRYGLERRKKGKMTVMEGPGGYKGLESTTISIALELLFFLGFIREEGSYQKSFSNFFFFPLVGNLDERNDGPDWAITASGQIVLGPVVFATLFTCLRTHLSFSSSIPIHVSPLFGQERGIVDSNANSNSKA